MKEDIIISLLEKHILKSGQINGQDNATLTKLYNKVFNANKKPTSCTSCVKQTIAKLAKVYVNTCEV